MSDPVYPLIPRDPASGLPMLVTRLECPESGVTLEGRFSLGWIARLDREQLEFVGLFVRSRGNVQRMASELGVAYNTVRARLDEVVEALSAPEPAAVLPSSRKPGSERLEVLERLRRRELSVAEALTLLGREPGPEVPGEG
ncbi:hypothetical protein HNR42_002665 [Deinobacterium chartae]|uniref:DUF2089 domain-containing protein n=1 Tax=Deinobacterium chartae TaxID=521158 RepID=A0A841I0N7_9DEIO|nr:DUF2089 domain-containing protein [Deinobacterium chartae]MBB6099227.1 hypothetical protein [Deinobacterium chartae]